MENEIQNKLEQWHARRISPNQLYNYLQQIRFTLLNLSVMFSTVDHELAMTRWGRIWLVCIGLNWTWSYWPAVASVHCDNATFTSTRLVLGPILYLNMCSILAIAQQKMWIFHLTCMQMMFRCTILHANRCTYHDPGDYPPGLSSSVCSQQNRDLMVLHHMPATESSVNCCSRLPSLVFVSRTSWTWSNHT